MQQNISSGSVIFHNPFHNLLNEDITEISPASRDPPQHLSIGVINPYALVGALTGKKSDWMKPELTKILSDVLKTDYAELFDMKFNSPLYAGLKLNPTTHASPVQS